MNNDCTIFQSEVTGLEHIRQIRADEELPYELLLLADPDRNVIDTYVHRSLCYVLELEKRLIGVYLLLPTRPATVELINIAVSEEFQGNGYGKRLVQHAITVSREMGYKTIEVGTGNSSIEQLRLYQKCGFRVVAVDTDYFIRNYSEPIYENGIQCMDMMRLMHRL